MNFFTRIKTRREIRDASLEMESARIKVMAKLHGQKLKMVESWGSKDTDYEMGWNDSLRSQLQQSDHKTPLSIQTVVQTMIGTSRELFIKNPFAQSAVFNLLHYVVGRGFSYRKTGSTPEQSKLIQAYWQAWASEANWPLTENEVLKRLIRDGEVLIQWFDDVPRFVEPNQLIATGDAPWGIFFDPKDQARIIAFNVCPLDINGNPLAADAKKVPVEQMEYERWPIVDMNAPRGMPPFYFFADNLNGALKCLKNMRELVAIQTAIAVIIKHPEGVTGSQIEAWASRKADKQPVDPDTGGTIFQKKLKSGTMLETKPGQEIEFPAAGMNAASFIEVVGADLRAVAAGLALPEFIFSADAGRSNYASLMAAEGPAVKTFESIQEFVGRFLQRCFDRVITKAANGGNADLKTKFGIQALDKAILLLPSQVEGPSVRTKDFFSEARTFQIESAAGVRSPQSWCSNRGLSYDEIMQQIVEHQGKYPLIPWPPTPPKQSGQAAEEFPPAQPAGQSGGSSGAPLTGSEKRAAQKNNG